MRVWIDLGNAPHVAFFLPIARELQRGGHQITVSLRDFNQTVELARLNGLEGSVVGRHGGRSTAGKVANLVGRSCRLAAFGSRTGTDVAVSHNSYTQTVAARLIGAKVVTIMDYEGQPANHIAFRCAHRVVVPQAFPAEDLRRFGCPERKVVRYEGFKEQVYLSDFLPDPFFGEALARACGLGRGWDPAGSVLVTVRAPASQAAYHPFENLLFEKLLTRLNGRRDVTVILLPRNREQEHSYRSKYPFLRIPSEPLSGNDLVHLSDLVVSAGGTMNREAAVLGTPACTVFAGKLPAVDGSLIHMGRLTAIESESDLDMLRFQKKNKGTVLRNPGLCPELASAIVCW